MAEGQTLEALLEEMEEAGEREDVSAGDLVDRFEDRSLGVLVAVLGLAGLIPGAIALPCVGLVLLGLALMVRDGLLALLGWAFAAGSAALLLWLL